ncbi:hypothetical protein TH66_12250 [Carbonactinospora thermoautotrophica]|uniref:DUF397 domain-containing protein n=1 Tax=Carbonactinospora thermoautotrophica TaxID=1469144 RepID=A0A132N167_9ACTN|nr:hypothetical protein LI90_3545 [Carbonactinospora thermoautotrophica]KWX03878.1 hypothetical protein TH66_12250 [Carbonactinospora thermoautotrophica]KWX07566.1 hypothetical protein TR74_18410 [Carbonactinospora thermoautotrophica]
MTDKDLLARAVWRVSSFSTGGGNGSGTCVQVAALDDGRIAVRNSNHPDKGVVFFTRAEMAAWIKGVKNGEFDDLT